MAHTRSIFAVLSPEDVWLIDRPPERVLADHVILWRSDPSDVEPLVLAVNESLDHLRPWMPWAQVPATTDTIAAFLGQASIDWMAGQEFQFLVRAAQSETVLGCCGLHARLGPGRLRDRLLDPREPRRTGNSYVGGPGAHENCAGLVRCRPSRDQVRSGERQKRGDPEEARLPAGSDRPSAADYVGRDGGSHDLGYRARAMRRWFVGYKNGCVNSSNSKMPPYLALAVIAGGAG